ncbi:hypothetical protein BKA67DRAFT_588986 [Truncatella angustata]|uniref:DUF2231 domain-containing protein n=1 Tax=Truncatella angustata TaxID=152316 RepID=A0A9P8RJL5_9PEZI|nr:uncharacterized protein BKA67DRAFT_588986 [Truncatella angustata]KAH6638623.1 hypothetical protein BKA67DRAFT_588986 [Truncatella angustata]KAH8203072.1 hypothetical protein TruAng_002800 [Truncatella angustata]
MGIVSDIYNAVELGNFQWPIRNSHPVHPSIVHFPLTFLTTAYSLDMVYGLASHYSKSITLATRLAPYLPGIAQFAYASHVVAVITSIPAMTSGSAEFWELYKKDGLNYKDKKLTNPGRSGDDIINRSINVGAAHGILNAVAFGVSMYAIISRWKVPGCIPGRASIWLSALTFPGLALSAALGGELVYGKGVGVQRMGNARDEKIAGLEAYKEKRAL